MNIIDPHLHLFALEHGHYHWLKPQNPPFWPDKHVLNRDFDDSELVLDKSATLQGYVHIEAGFDNAEPWREIDWLEQHCTRPMRSIAGLDVLATNANDVLHRINQRRSVVGIRHILDHNAAAILTHSSAHQVLGSVADKELLFEAQYAIQDTEATTAVLNVLAKIPELRLVINHAGFPPLNGAATIEDYTHWLTNLERLAENPQVWIKLSGWEMAHRQWQHQHVQNVITQTVRLFGDDRVMMASNFPLSNWSGSYAQLWQRYQQLLSNSPKLSAKLLHDNAFHCYRFDDAASDK